MLITQTFTFENIWGKVLLFVGQPPDRSGPEDRSTVAQEEPFIPMCSRVSRKSCWQNAAGAQNPQGCQLTKWPDRTAPLAWLGPHCDSFRRRSPLECRRCCLSEDFYEYLLKGHNAIISPVTSCLAEMFHLSNWIDKGPVIFRWIRTRFRNWHIYFKEGISCQIGEIVAWIENCHTGEGKFNKTLPRAQRTQALRALTLTLFNFSFIITQLSLSTQSRGSSRNLCVELPVSMGGGGSSA